MQTKATLPIDLLSEVNAASIVKTYFEFNHLKQLYRQGWLLRGVPLERCESVAEHSFGVALLTLFLADSYFPHLDQTKIITMALIHDFGEIYAGDFTPSDNIEAAEKHKLERQSVIKVLQSLPNGDAYISIWEEFESGESPEAQFVRQIDRLEMGLQASVYSHQNLVDPSAFFQSAMMALQEPQLQSILKDLENLS